ncbi:retrovirus-related pol polyprotein from transposon TNT 1-94 [Tanacetum coccineum]
MDADKLLAERLQQEEREQFTVDEQARILVDLIAERKKFFATQRAEQIRNKPPTRAQLRNKMMVKDIGKEDGDSQKQAESSKKRSRAEHDEESVKKQKLEDETEREELRACLDIVLGDDIAMDLESLATKYPIIDWNIHILTENMMYYQIIRADGSSKNYKIFSGMLDDFDKQDVIDLYRLVIVNGDAPAIASASTEGPIPLKTAEQKLARKNELKAKSTLLLAIPDDHLLKFHGIKDAKTLWEAIKTRFRGNKESKKMQKTILKQQYKNFTASRSEGLDKTYDRFQKLISHLEIHDTMSMDDLYNNLKVYEAKIKSQSSSSSNSQNVVFVSSENTSNTNEAVNTAHELGNKDLEQIDTDDLEEMDLKRQVAMLTIRVKRFLKKTGRNLNFNGKENVGFDKIKVECYNYYRRGHFARECRAPRNQGNRSRDVSRRIVPVETPTNALVVQDGIGSSSSDSKNVIGFDSQLTENELHDIHKNNSKVFVSASDSSVNEIEEENNYVNDRFKKVEGYHAVPPPYTGNYMPSRHDLSFARLDDSVIRTNVREPISPVVPRKINCQSKVILNTAEQSSSVPKNSDFKEKVNTAKVNNVTTAGTKAVVSVVQGHEENIVKSSTCWIWRPTGKVIDHISKDSGSYMPKRFDYVDPKADSSIENQINLKVKIIRCDNGTEFKNSEMNQFCEMKGIKREFSVARTPQQNGAEAINTACYVQNRVLITKPHNKTPYELLIGRSPNLDFMRPFGCPVTILNTLDHLGKFEGKADEGFLVGYSVNSKAFRVFNTRTKKVEENLHIKFLENKPNVAGSGPKWLFDIDSLTKSMNYEPVTAGNQTNDDAGIETNVNAVQTRQEKASNHEYILLPFLTSDSQGLKSLNDEFVDDAGKKNDAHTNRLSTVSAAEQSFDNNDLPTDPLMPNLEDSTGIFRGAYDDEDVGAEADLNNLETTMNVSPIPTTRIHKDYPKDQIIGDINSAIQTRRTINFFEENAMVWTLVHLPNGKRAIGTKWVYRNKKDERGIVIRNRVEKALYGLHEAPRSWYETLSTYLIENGFRRGTIDKTLFIKKDKGDILLVQVYVNDIIFGSTKKSLCDEFKGLMHKKFQMSSMGELTFFLRTTSTPMEPNKALVKDEEAYSVDVHLYRSMIISLMYLTASRPDITFAVCACARFQVTPKTSHLHTVKRIFIYLKGNPQQEVVNFLERGFIAAANCCGQVLWIQVSVVSLT